MEQAATVVSIARGSPQDIEAEIVADIEAAIEAEIVSEHYFDAYRGRDKEYDKELFVVCILALRDGSSVIGESPGVSPENFDGEVERKIAREKAAEKVWRLVSSHEPS